MIAEKKINILLVDDHKIVRQCLRDSLNQQENIDVIAEADDGRMALDFVAKRKPDVVVMDISMPNLNGMDAAKQILKTEPGIKIIVLTMHAEKRYVMSMLESGVSGYLLKTSPFEELISAVETVMKGKTVLCSEVTDIVVHSAVNPTGKMNPAPSNLLTIREREILQLLTEGKTLSHIAEKLFISKKTIQTHRLNLMKKLNLNNIVELTKFAVKEGITTIDN